MNSYRRNNQAPFAPIVIAVVVFVAFFFGIDYASGGFVRSQARALSSSVFSLIPGSEGIINFFASRRALQRDNERLAGELIRLAEKSAALDALETENAALRQMASAAASMGSGVTAPVLSSLRASPYGTFVIGAGADDNIGEGSLVMTSGGFVIGRVVHADRRTAQVESVFAPEAQTDLMVRELSFQAEGRGGGNARASVPRDSAIAIGDTATAGIFSGRPVGIIGHIESASSSAESIVYVRVPVNLDTLRFVYVLPR